MLKVFKIVFGLAAFIVLALLALPFFIDVNDYKPEISKAVYDATGRNLDIEHIRLSAFPWVGITLKQVKLENAPGFQHPYMMTIDTVDVQLDLVSLLNQQIEVKRFLLDSPRIWLEKRADASNNWQDLQAGAQKNGTTPSPKASAQPKQSATQHAMPAIALNAELLQLQHGQVIWSDASRGNITVSNIDVSVKDLQFHRPIQLELAASIQDSPLRLQAEVGPLGSLDKLDIHKLPLRLNITAQHFALAALSPYLPQPNQATLAHTGDLSQGHISLDVSVEQHQDGNIISSGHLQAMLKNTADASWKIRLKSLSTLNIQDFKLALNDTHLLELSGSVKHLDRKPSYELRMETAKLQRIWLNQFLPELQALYQYHPAPWQSLKLGALIAGDADILDIRDLQLDLNDEHIQASGNMAWGKAPDIQLRVTINTLHLDPWLPRSTPKAKSQPATSAKPQQDTKEPDLTFLKPWYVSLQLNAKRIDAMQLQMDNLRLTLSTEKGVVRLNPLKFEITGGSVAENFTLYANTYPVTWKESIKLNGVAIQPILKAVADFDKLSGKAQLTTSLSGKGLLPANITRNLNGSGNFVFEDGQFKGVDIAKEVRKFKKLDTTSQNTTDFAQMQGSFRIKNGVLNNPDLFMSSPLFRLTGQGQVNLNTLSLDYRVRPRLVNSLAGQGGERNIRGVEVPLHLFGSFENIQVKVEMDKNALINSAAAINNASGKPIGGVGGKVLDQGFVKTRDEEIAAAKDRLAEKAKKKAAEKLKDVFKGFGF